MVPEVGDGQRLLARQLIKKHDSRGMNERVVAILHMVHCLPAAVVLRLVDWPRAEPHPVEEALGSLRGRRRKGRR